MRTSRKIYFILIQLFFIPAIFADEAEKTEETAPKRKNIVIDPSQYEKLVTEKIFYETLDYSLIKEHCEKMLSPDGYILPIPERNMIIVHDKTSTIEKIRALIKAADAPAVNIRIDIFSNYSGSSPDDKLNIDFKYNTGDKDKIIIENGKVKKPDLVKIEAKKGSQINRRDNSSFIVTMSGKPATLFTGKEIVDPQWLANYKLVPTIIVTGGGSVIKLPGKSPEMKWKNVGTALRVLPILKDSGMIEVEVYPEVSYIDGEGKKQAVKVETVSTKLTVMPGQIIPLGGVVDKHREFYSNFFGLEFSRTGGGGILDMSIRATVIEPVTPKERNLQPSN